MLSLKESKAATDLAQFLCEFLPGSGYSQWKGHVSFKTVAEKVGVDDFWQVGSKLPMLTSLLQRTLEHRRHLFEPLILEIVRAGIIYLKKYPWGQFFIIDKPREGKSTDVIPKKVGPFKCTCLR